MIMKLNLDHHIKSECLKRLDHCDYCWKEFPHDQLEDHKNDECSKRPVECDCGLKMMVSEIELHRIIDCTFMPPAEVKETHTKYNVNTTSHDNVSVVSYETFYPHESESRNSLITGRLGDGEEWQENPRECGDGRGSDGDYKTPEVTHRRVDSSNAPDSERWGHDGFASLQFEDTHHSRPAPSAAPRRRNNPPPETAESKLFVRGLNPKVTTEDLTWLFEPFGRVMSARIAPCKEGLLRFGFVTMAVHSEAQRASDELDGSRFCGETIGVEWSKSGERRNEMCRVFAERGECLRGDNCRFQHQMPERPVATPERVKCSEICPDERVNGSNHCDREERESFSQFVQHAYHTGERRAIQVNAQGASRLLMAALGKRKFSVGQ
jgi:hypothetical protein